MISGVVLYARVSSHDRRADLDRQIARLTDWAMANGFRIDQVVGEVGCGLNGKRPEAGPDLVGPICHGDRCGASRPVGPRRDRAPWGRLAGQGGRVVVVDDDETSDDLVGEVIEVLTGMCARLSGRRGARNRALRAVTAAKQQPEPAQAG